MAIMIIAVLALLGFVGIFSLVKAMISEQRELDEIAKVLNEGGSHRGYAITKRSEE
jgi:hypothetical protein